MLFLTSPMAFGGARTHDFMFTKPNAVTPIRPQLRPLPIS